MSVVLKGAPGWIENKFDKVLSVIQTLINIVFISTGVIISLLVIFAGVLGAVLLFIT
jgi:hypothetical protein